MSGCRCMGSSLGSGLKTISDLLPVFAITFRASSRMVNSSGFPRLTGPVKSSGVAIKQTRSFCYVDDLIEAFVRLMATPDITERARLLAVPVDGDGRALQGLRGRQAD